VNGLADPRTPFDSIVGALVKPLDLEGFQLDFFINPSAVIGVIRASLRHWRLELRSLPNGPWNARCRKREPIGAWLCGCAPSR
jgi:hypothetical protein